MDAWKARDILRRHRHRNRGDWLCSGGEVFLPDTPVVVRFSEFEAVAIASAYERAASRNAAEAVMKTLEDAGLIRDPLTIPLD